MDQSNPAELVSHLRASFNAGKTRPLEWRLGQLRALGRMLTEQEAAFSEAAEADLGKSNLEFFLTELNVLQLEIQDTCKKLRRWMKPSRTGTPLVTQPGKSRIHKDPLGVVLILSAWNYPVNLAIAPMIGAIAAGNCVVLKPSEVAANTSALLTRLLTEYCDQDCVRVYEGAVPETTALLVERFDHILYTGNGHVGRIIMAAASKHLTPVTLELGGKSPVYVHPDADLEMTARRILWGKFTNAGQTCIAPDYLLVHKDIHDRLLEIMASTARDFYGEDPSQSPDYGRIINARHHRRVMALMGSGTPVTGGVGDEATRYIAPTILKDVSPDSPAMQDEIFGPVLPVLPIDGPDAAIAFVNDRPKPLALYVFSGQKSVVNAFIERTSSGGVTVNHVMLHFAVMGLPFGGVGESGQGAYHGRHTFETFTHHKSVLRKPLAIDPAILYPPYTDKKKAWLKRLV